MLKLLPFLLLLAAPAQADTFNFFYPCASGVVDCSAFPKHNYGEFEMTGPNLPLSSDPGITGGKNYNTAVTESNIHGQVLGIMWTVYSGAYAFTGIGGIIHPELSTNGVDGRFAPVDINNNGMYAINIQGGSNGSYVVVGHDNLTALLDGPALAAQLGALAVGVGGDVAYGLNDENQLLVDLSVVYDGPSQINIVRGVLSPTAVPEPSALLLLATAIGIAKLTAAFRFAKPSR